MVGTYRTGLDLGTQNSEAAEVNRVDTKSTLLTFLPHNPEAICQILLSPSLQIRTMKKYVVSEQLNQPSQYHAFAAPSPLPYN